MTLYGFLKLIVIFCAISSIWLNPKRMELTCLDHATRFCSSLFYKCSVRIIIHRLVCRMVNAVAYIHECSVVFVWSKRT